ncbi:MAG: isocitrate lyase/phosphoenolpyruvate mutase family protein [Pseudomonadota bacterium]|nr:isocitrate lyase/phosphoenolpyruvate mutase family protein [Pseudomonadota bacterium]
MSQTEKAIRFAELHRKGDPLVLYNIWDAAGAKALVEEGVPAVATGSWAMAAAHGYEDGESIPLDFVLRIIERICATVSVPVLCGFRRRLCHHPCCACRKHPQNHPRRGCGDQF